MEYAHPLYHQLKVRQALYLDETLGVGNFLFKVLAQDVNRWNALFALERPFMAPKGAWYATLSLHDLATVVGELASWYLQQGVVAGNIVCTYTSEGISQFLHFLALTSIRAIPAPVNCRMKPSIALLYHQKYHFDFLVYDAHDHSAALAEQTRGMTGILAYGMADASLPVVPAGDWPAQYHRDDTVMICHSSGTTGIPKAVLFGHQQFFYGKRERLLSFLQADKEKMLCALPHSHSAGISYLMTAVLLGLPTQVLSDLTGAGLRTHIAEFQPTVLVGFPQTYSALAEMELASGEFPFLRRFYNTGDTAHEVHIQALLKAAPDAGFYDGFGASELGMALFGKISTRDNVASGRCVGQPVPFAKVKIINELGQRLPSGQIGYIAIESRSITAGYYRDEALTQRSRTDDGYWLTGDIGYLDREGAFYHLDRVVDVIHTPQGPAYTLELEELVLKQCAIDDITIVGVTQSPRASEMIVAMIKQTTAESVDLCRQVHAVLAAKLSDAAPVCVVNLAKAFVPPSGATGKILKRVIRERFWQDLQHYQNQDRSTFEYVLDATARHRHDELCSEI